MHGYVKNPFSIIGVVALVIFLAIAAYSQGTGRNIANSPTGPFGESIERRNRETALRSITMIANSRKPDAPVDYTALKRLNDDFARIQVIRLAMVRDIKDGRQFDYKRLADDASEIKKRASRLKEGLALSAQDEKDHQPFEKVEFDKDKIQDAASDLCLEISRFTQNPMFRPGAVLNVRNAKEAEHALDTVINLSTNIKISADKLRNEN